jgi:hypothetical protein
VVQVGGGMAAFPTTIFATFSLLMLVVYMCVSVCVCVQSTEHIGVLNLDSMDAKADPADQLTFVVFSRQVADVRDSVRQQRVERRMKSDGRSGVTRS